MKAKKANLTCVVDREFFDIFTAYMKKTGYKRNFFIKEAIKDAIDQQLAREAELGRLTKIALEDKNNRTLTLEEYDREITQSKPGRRKSLVPPVQGELQTQTFERAEPEEAFAD